MSLPAPAVNLHASRSQRVNPKINPARDVAAFFHRMQQNHMDFSMAMGCAVFSMNVLVGVYLLFDGI
jgi:hypothetical protein